MTHKQKFNGLFNPKALLCLRGFSLVEMAVVLLIIGLIAGSVLKGQQLIENAKLTTIVSQIRTCETAYATFFSTYNAHPGDFQDAKDSLDDILENGDGDGVISGNGFEGESLQFWQHLSRAGLLSVEPLTGTPDFGHGVPSTKFGGGITVTYDNTDESHWFVIGARHGTSGQGALFTPQQAQFIIQKLNGSIKAMEGQGASGKCLINQKLNLKNKKTACILYVKF